MAVGSESGKLQVKQWIDVCLDGFGGTAEGDSVKR